MAELDFTETGEQYSVLEDPEERWRQTWGSVVPWMDENAKFKERVENDSKIRDLDKATRLIVQCGYILTKNLMRKDSECNVEDIQIAVSQLCAAMRMLWTDMHEAWLGPDHIDWQMAWFNYMTSHMPPGRDTFWTPLSLSNRRGPDTDKVRENTRHWFQKPSEDRVTQTTRQCLDLMREKMFDAQDLLFESIDNPGLVFIVTEPMRTALLTAEQAAQGAYYEAKRDDKGVLTERIFDPRAKARIISDGPIPM